jgi:hypothetical protein
MEKQLLITRKMNRVTHQVQIYPPSNVPQPLRSQTTETTVLTVQVQKYILTLKQRLVKVAHKTKPMILSRRSA